MIYENRTHLNIARLSIRETNESSQKCKIGGFKKIMFYLEIIVPDLSIMQFIHPHLHERSSEYIYSKIKRMQEKDKYGLFSVYELGKTVHYLCDFC